MWTALFCWAPLELGHSEDSWLLAGSWFVGSYHDWPNDHLHPHQYKVISQFWDVLGSAAHNWWLTQESRAPLQLRHWFCSATLGYPSWCLGAGVGKRYGINLFPKSGSRHSLAKTDSTTFNFLSLDARYVTSLSPGVDVSSLRPELYLRNNLWPFEGLFSQWISEVSFMSL